MECLGHGFMLCPRPLKKVSHTMSYPLFRSYNVFALGLGNDMVEDVTSSILQQPAVVSFWAIVLGGRWDLGTTATCHGQRANTRTKRRLWARVTNRGDPH